LPVHMIVPFTLIGISEFASSNNVELTPLGSPIPEFQCHLFSIHGKGLGHTLP
jgi:hypothetical protein